MKKLTAVLLACTVFMTGILGHCKPVKAAFVLPATEAGIAAGQTLQWLYTVLLSMGVAINLKEMIRYRDPTDGYEWLDEPASQGEIDALDEKIGTYYDNAVAEWYKNHGGKLSPTPEPTKTPDPTQSPDISPPAEVTPAPTSVPPEILEKIDSWAEMRQKALQNKVLALGAGAAVCLKEAVTGWWNEVMDNDETYNNNNEKNPYAYKDMIGFVEYNYKCSGYLVGYQRYYMYYPFTTQLRPFYVSDQPDMGKYMYAEGCSGPDPRTVSFNPADDNKFCYYAERYSRDIYTGEEYLNSVTGKGAFDTQDSNVNEYNCTYNFYAPYYLNGQLCEGENKPLIKPVIWPVPSLKGDYDNNNSPTLPIVPVPIIIPGLDEIQELNKNANDSDDDDRPTIIQNFINNHTAKDPTPTPQPTPSTTPAVVPDPDPGTDPDPDPTGAPDPDPNPTVSPKATPNPTPALPVDPDISPGPSTAPEPNPTGSPDNPDKPGSDDVDPDKYKTDLRLVFPFCIPFDLIHLLEVLDAEPEAPRFEIPVDIEAENPFTGKKIVDYHTTIVIDMSDYEEPVKVVRIFEIMFFILGLMLITRQHMIKG